MSDAAKVARIAAMRADGRSYREIGKALGISKDKAQKIGRRGEKPHGAFRLAKRHRLAREIHLRGDCVVCGDLHASAVDPELVEKALEMGKRYEIRQIAVVGDVVNFDVFGLYPHLMRVAPVSEEIEVAGRVFRHWLAWFEKIYVCRGNHDARLITYSEGQFNMDMIGDLMLPGEDRKRLVMSNYDRIWLRNEGGLWLLCHQKQYSRNRLVVAAALSAKHQCHVVTHHQHGIGVGLSPDGRFVIADNGCMCDPSRIPYKRMNTNSMPEWHQGFAVISKGSYLFYAHKLPVGIK